jgi:hypothetical protein
MAAGEVHSETPSSTNGYLTEALLRKLLQEELRKALGEQTKVMANLVNTFPGEASDVSSLAASITPGRHHHHVHDHSLKQESPGSDTKKHLSASEQAVQSDFLMEDQAFKMGAEDEDVESNFEMMAEAMPRCSGFFHCLGWVYDNMGVHQARFLGDPISKFVESHFFFFLHPRHHFLELHLHVGRS